MSDKNYIIYNWDNCDKELEKMGFPRAKGVKINPKPDQNIWDAAKFIFEYGLNVMIKHGDELDILLVSSGRFTQR